MDRCLKRLKSVNEPNQILILFCSFMKHHLKLSYYTTVYAVIIERVTWVMTLHKLNCKYWLNLDSTLHQFELTLPRGHGNATSSATRPPTSENLQASADQRKVITNGIGITSNSPMFQTATFRNSSCSTPPPSVVASTIANSHRNLAINLENMNLFPCLNPVNPHMKSEKSRLQTFLDHSSSWPTHIACRL